MKKAVEAPTLKQLFKSMMLKEVEMVEADGVCMRARREMLLQTMAYKDCNVPFNKQRAKAMKALYQKAVTDLAKVRSEFDLLHQQVMDAPLDPKEKMSGRTFAGTWSI